MKNMYYYYRIIICIVFDENSYENINLSKPIEKSLVVCIILKT